MKKENFWIIWIILSILCACSSSNSETGKQAFTERPNPVPDETKKSGTLLENSDTARKTDSGDKIKILEDIIFQKVNEYRQKSGKPKLLMNERLYILARRYSRDMQERSFFSHTDPDGRNPQERLLAAGISFKTSAENLAKVSKKKLEPSEVMQQWLNSAAHHKNLLEGRYLETGIGIFWDGSQTYYVTQIFVEPVKKS